METVRGPGRRDTLERVTQSLKIQLSLTVAFRPVKGIAEIVFGGYRCGVLNQSTFVVQLRLPELAFPEVPVAGPDLRTVALSLKHHWRRKHQDEHGHHPLSAPEEAPAVAGVRYHKLYQHKYQCYGKEIHILLVILLEDHRLEVLLLQATDLVNHRIESELGVAGPDIKSLAGRSHLFQGRLVQTGHHDIAVLVLQQLAVHRYGLALRRADSDAEHPCPHIHRIPGRSHRVVLVVLAVGYQDDGAAVLTLGCKTPDGRPYGLSHRRTLNRH